MSIRSLPIAGVVLTFTVAAAHAAPITVGSGANEAAVFIQFSDGALYQFDVGFGVNPPDTTTGIGLFDIIEAGSTLSTTRQTFGSSVFIDGITFAGHSDEGYAGGDNWWHYWTREAGETTWTEAVIGAGDRVVQDGDADGWVYGSALPPAPEPAALVLLAVGALLGGVRRRAVR